MNLQEHEIKKLTGLTSAEAQERLRKYGYNELPSSKKRSVFKIIFEILHEPMFILLVVCGALYLFLGDFEEAMMLLGFVFVVMGITIYQENKTEKALDTLKDLSSPRALVIRDGIETRIAGREVVMDDLIIIREGDRIPSDAVLIWERNVTVDESILTGESVPVRKKSHTDENIEARKPGGDDIPFIFSGTLAVQGQGVGRVIATGMQTELGKIGKALSGIEEEQTILQKETGRIVKTVFLIAAVLCVLIIVIYGFTRGNWMMGILSGITLAMAMLPEEFPVVLTIFLALGAWRMSKKQVLTRRIGAVETLGSATVLCVDKTGTLTQNRMSIKKLSVPNHSIDIDGMANRSLPEPFHQLIEYGILASKKDPFDPMERALIDLGKKTLFETEHLHDDWSIFQEYPLSRELLSLSHVYRSPGQGPDEGEWLYIIAAKGAPEAIIDLCHLDDTAANQILQNLTIMSGEGLRVIGVAKAVSMQENLPGHQHEFDFRFIGLIGLADPIRETVPQAIRECYGAGIQVVMITGDYPGTALNIARQIGLKETGPIITGPELEKMTPGELKKIIHSVNIFARVVPEQKLLIVNALKGME
jgi:Ca2+-transporting ATPase